MMRANNETSCILSSIALLKTGDKLAKIFSCFGELYFLLLTSIKRISLASIGAISLRYLLLLVCLKLLISRSYLPLRVNSTLDNI